MSISLRYITCKQRSLVASEQASDLQRQKRNCRRPIQIASDNPSSLQVQTISWLASIPQFNSAMPAWISS